MDIRDRVVLVFLTLTIAGKGRAPMRSCQRISFKRALSARSASLKSISKEAAAPAACG